MRFRIRASYRAEADAVARAFADPALYAAFSQLPRADRPDVLEHHTAGDSVTLRVRWRFAGTLSPKVRAVIDPDLLTWVEESNHDLSRRLVRFRMIADHYRDRFSCAGEYRFDSDGEGSVRTVDGDLRIKALLVARTVENAIVSGLQHHILSEVPIVEAFVAGPTGS